MRFMLKLATKQPFPQTNPSQQTHHNGVLGDISD
jgi:hypothetical protein